MYFHIITSFLNEREPFSKTWGKNKQQKTPKFLNFTFLDTFCICSRKNGGKWCLCFNTSYFTYFWYSLCRKLIKCLDLHCFGEIFTHAIWLSVLIHHVFVRPFCGRLKSPGFSSLYKTPNRASSKLSGLIWLTNIKGLYIMACLKLWYVRNVDLRYPYIVKP